jgi:hypothetical protein
VLVSSREEEAGAGVKMPVSSQGFGGSQGSVGSSQGSVGGSRPQSRRERLSQFNSPPDAAQRTRRQTLSDPRAPPRPSLLQEREEQPEDRQEAEREDEQEDEEDESDLPVHADVEDAIEKCAKVGGVEADMYKAFRKGTLALLEAGEQLLEQGTPPSGKVANALRELQMAYERRCQRGPVRRDSAAQHSQTSNANWGRDEGADDPGGGEGAGCDGPRLSPQSAVSASIDAFIAASNSDSSASAPSAGNGGHAAAAIRTAPMPEQHSIPQHQLLAQPGQKRPLAAALVRAAPASARVHIGFKSRVSKFAKTGGGRAVAAPPAAAAPAASASTVVGTEPTEHVGANLAAQPPVSQQPPMQFSAVYSQGSARKSGGISSLSRGLGGLARSQEPLPQSSPVNWSQRSSQPEMSPLPQQSQPEHHQSSQSSQASQLSQATPSMERAFFSKDLASSGNLPSGMSQATRDEQQCAHLQQTDNGHFGVGHWIQNLDEHGTDRSSSGYNSSGGGGGGSDDSGSFLSPTSAANAAQLRTEQQRLIAGRRQDLANEQEKQDQRDLFHVDEEQRRDLSREKFEQERDAELDALRVKERAREAQKQRLKQKQQGAFKKRSYSSFAEENGTGDATSASMQAGNGKLPRLGGLAAAPFDPAQAWTQGPWLSLLKEAKAPPFGSQRLSSCAQHVLRYGQQIGKVERLLLVISTVDRGGGHTIGATDARVTLEDPTGTVWGTINKELLEDDVGGPSSLAENIAVGAALDLRNVSLMMPRPGKVYLNIARPNNVAQVVGASTVLQQQPGQHTFGKEEGDGDDGGRNESDPRAVYDEEMLREASGEQQRRREVVQYGSLAEGMMSRHSGPGATAGAQQQQQGQQDGPAAKPSPVLRTAAAAAPFRCPRQSSSSGVSSSDLAATAATPFTQTYQNGPAPASSIVSSAGGGGGGGGGGWGKKPTQTAGAWGGVATAGAGAGAGAGSGAASTTQRPASFASVSVADWTGGGGGFGAVKTTQQPVMHPPAPAVQAPTDSFAATGAADRAGTSAVGGGSTWGSAGGGGFGGGGFGGSSGSGSSSSGSSGSGWGQRQQPSPVVGGTGGGSGTGSWGQRGSQPVVAWQGAAAAAGVTPRNPRHSQHAVTPVPSPFSQQPLASQFGKTPPGPGPGLGTGTVAGFGASAAATVGCASTMTAEQKARIEANKQRALERRQKRLAAQQAAAAGCQ